MADETNDWTAPQVAPLTDADGASNAQTARARNLIPLDSTPT